MTELSEEKLLERLDGNARIIRNAVADECRTYVGNKTAEMLEQAASEIRALRARVKALEEGLRPFALEGSEWINLGISEHS